MDKVNLQKGQRLDILQQAEEVGWMDRDDRGQTLNPRDLENTCCWFLLMMFSEWFLAGYEVS